MLTIDNISSSYFSLMRTCNTLYLQKLEFILKLFVNKIISGENISLSAGAIILTVYVDQTWISSSFIFLYSVERPT